MALFAVSLMTADPAALAGQTELSRDAQVYLAAADSLSTLGASAVVEDHACSTAWRREYGLPVRCRPAMPRRGTLTLLAERLDVPLAEESTACGSGSEAWSLALSPVQFSSYSSAWFVATLLCVGAQSERLYLVETEYREGGWAIKGMRRLDEG